MAQETNQIRPSPTHLAPIFSTAMVPMIVAAVVRILVLLTTHGMTYDGTYYLRQAERILQGTFQWEGFPPGYPVLIAGLQWMVQDGVLAARLISLAAGIASIPLFYSLARRMLDARWAWGLALLFALHPELVLTSTSVLTESLYIFLVLLGIWWFEKDKHTAAALPLGYAFLLRPEVLAILLGLLLFRWIQRRRIPWGFLLITAAFVATYSLMVSIDLGKLVITPKQGQLDLGEAVLKRSMIFFKTFHLVLPVVLLPLAIREGWRRRSPYLIPMIYLLSLPLYEIHIQQRMHLPAAPFIAILGAAFLVRLGKTMQRSLALICLALLVVGTREAWPNMYRVLVLTPHAKEIGEYFRPYLKFEDRVGSRFPFVPYHAGANLVRFPLLNYAPLIDSLETLGATHILLLESEMTTATPHLKPLFEDARAVASDSRLVPVASFDKIPGSRASLYALRPAPIRPDNVRLVAEGVHDFDWRSRKLRVVQATTQRASLPVLEYMRSANDEAVALILRRGRETVIAIEHAENDISILDSTAPYKPTSVCWIGTDVLFIANVGSPALKLLRTRTNRIQTVVYEGVEADFAVPTFVTTRGRDVAITYLPNKRENADTRILATLQWPEQLPKTGEIVIGGNWATEQSLADDAICWAFDRDELFAVRALSQLDEKGNIVNVHTSLAVITKNGSSRKLCFDFNEPRHPKTFGNSLAFLAAEGSLYQIDLSNDDLSIPPVLVFPPLDNPQRK